MHRMTFRPVVLVLAAAGFLLLGTSVASAHVEASVQSGQPGSSPVVIGFNAEAESSTAGIAGIRTQLPDGVLPEWVSLVSAPSGWTLTASSDGFQLEGPALPTHTAAEYSIRIGQLPTDRAQLNFKTWVRYTDGHEDAWIQEPTPVDPSPESPAPSIKVATVPGGGTASPGSGEATPLGGAATTTAPGSAATAPAAGGTSAGTIAGFVILGVLVLAAVGVGVWYLRARSRPTA